MLLSKFSTPNQSKKSTTINHSLENDLNSSKNSNSSNNSKNKDNNLNIENTNNNNIDIDEKEIYK